MLIHMFYVCSPCMRTKGQHSVNGKAVDINFWGSGCGGESGFGGKGSLTVRGSTTAKASNSLASTSR